MYHTLINLLTLVYRSVMVILMVLFPFVRMILSFISDFLGITIFFCKTNTNVTNVDRDKTMKHILKKNENEIMFLITLFLLLLFLSHS